MADKHAATYHPGRADCGCPEVHTSVLASIYCAEQMETEQREARREPKRDRPKVIIRGID